MTSDLLKKVKKLPVRMRNGSVAFDAPTALAWLSGEVRLVQVQKVLWPDKPISATVNRAYGFLLHSLQKAYQQGNLIVKGDPTVKP
jgi:hypothetical protein